MSQESGGPLGGLIGGNGGGIGKVLQDLIGGGAVPNGQPKATAKPGASMPENQSSAIPLPGAPQGQRPAGPPPGMPPKPQNTGQAGAGFGDLLDRLRGAGLGDQVDSWVGKGQNKPIDASQVTEALGPKQVHDLAQRAGIPDAQVADGLAKALPQVIDKVTPQGQIPDPGALQGNIARLLGS
jgi:uncharacterized protein YidB (DUF937 family)